MKSEINRLPIMLLRMFIIASAIPLLTHCTFVPDYQRPAIATPEQWQTDINILASDTTSNTARVKNTTVDNDEVSANWWQGFGSAELNNLMSEALTANQNLAAATARIQRARAANNISRADLFPNLNASASANRTTGSDTDTSKRGSASLTTAYEVDLWGARSADIQAAGAQLAASVYSMEAVRLVLQSELAAQYFQALSLKDRLSIANGNLDAGRRILELIQVRVDNGAASQLELAQQNTAVYNLEANIFALQRQLQQTQHALAILIGKPPQGFVITGSSLADIQLPQIKLEQPTDLLERRPDIRQSEALLIAANADIGVARAALYPSLRLSASYTLEGLLDGGRSTLTSLVASLTQMLFDGGRLHSLVAQTEASRNEMVAGYIQTVLVSFQEVEDSMVDVKTNALRSQAFANAVESSQQAYQITTLRYENGAEDLLNLLDSQRSQLSAQDNLVQAELARYTATTNLFKALGGGWVSSTIEAVVEKNAY